MQSKRREILLKIVAVSAAGVFLLDKLVLSPALTSWKEQSDRLADLRQKVQRGRQLLEREESLRGRWDEMKRTDLPEDVSVAENNIFKAMGKWTTDSRISFTSLTPQWRNHEGYDTFEFRASAVGDQASIGRLLYEIEADPLPARVEDCEVSTRDAQGKQLGLSVRFSLVRLNQGGSQ